MPPPGSAPARGGMDGAAVAAACLVFAVLVLTPALLNDGDTLWQITTGDWIISHRAIPRTDPFSFTAGDRRWFAHEWGAEVLMALAYRAGGMAGVMALAAAAAGLAAGLLIYVLRRFLPGIYATLLAVLAFAAAAPSILARPHLLAWPCLVGWTGALVLARTRRAPPPWALLPVMLLWANLHGSFIAGLLLAAAFGLEALLDPGANRPRVGRAWITFIAAATATAALTPDGPATLLFPLHHLGMKSLTWIGEWQPPSFAQLTPLEIILLGLLALGFTGRVALPPVRLLLLLALVHAALAHTRNAQLLGLVGALILAEPFGRSLGRGAAAPAPLRRLVPTGAALLAALALAARLLLPLDPARTGAAFAAALQTLPPQLRTQHVLNSYSLGGLLIFNGVRPFVDSRADLYGDAFLSRYARLTEPDLPELRRTLDEYGIAWTLFPATSPLVAVLDGMPGWHRVLDDAGIVAHARTQIVGKTSLTAP